MAIAAVSTGCGEKAAQTIAEKAMEKAIESEAAEDGEDVDVKVDISKGTMTVAGADGEKVNMKMDADNGTMTITGADGEQVGMKIDATEGGATMTTADGTEMLSGANAKLPDDFPEDVPQYKGMQLVMVTKMPDGNLSVTATTPDSIDKVAAFYKKEAEANGWNEEMSMDMGEMKNLQYKKADRGMIVLVIKDEKETGIQLTIVNE
ncbi:MAG: hypothetical protein GY851_29545 [bacterium]|nr:hypothetical protein [bacterium]